MVGLVVGIVVLTAATVAFLSVSNSRREMERTDRQIENGRYAVQLVSDDLVLAGYWGEFDPTIVAAPASLANGTSGDPCTVDNTNLKGVVAVHIQGYDLGANAPTCISDVKTNTDIVAIRRASTCIAGAGVTDCAAAPAGTTYMQSTLCNAELALPTIGQRYVVSSTLADFNTMHKRDCATTADVRKYIVHIYYIANNNNAGDGIPTLKRVDLGAGAMSQPTPLVEGIDNLQVEYGLMNGSGTPTVYTADPSTYAGCAGAACVTNWTNVGTVKIYLLARSTDASPSYTDTKVYAMGLKADNSAQTVGPFNDRYKRHLFTTLVRLNNAAGRRE
jgi:type IV pilus assembly protein PilW